ncbi:2-succinyl-5-enolpyruvyl-6-hydroxy-3-cyclohexene-1-carboxylic-acid synthase [Corynebacterium epidermidicanis]|uniref:2-succinyl-5-enolpyruvyl-6-hydroxy-3-cyclohexene-1-carboxylate synthase n=1 Tax=Corynebacterium epidermidicanis TaxID=1050174 RepID=A0A0G3GRS8_9CORY|nr:2-succinyl-5-enolpyruvyl-6-hydroxy-3-cyclohexene-1-carboxylic-acid synthase [Corynebacterium epidermidicanis]AKK02238.1 2-succinyl-5-enolpyruvyl-6-hydroxy-3-cyclohexene-1-carboxylic-acid synthase [Corynebacterium epidermidicanis]
MTAVDVANRIVAELIASGMTDVVACPGSRNAPLLLALAKSPLKLHMRIDERSAAFLALGLGRVQKRPVAVVMTSGTAVANTLPAVIEAQLSGTPLLILSADRPGYFVGTGASQTIQQNGLFEPYAETFNIEVDTRPDTAAATLRRALARPVSHVNVGFRNPLVGQSELIEASKHSIKLGERDWGTKDLDLTKNTLVVAGDGSWAVEGLEDVPTIAEPTAPAPYHAVHPLAAGVFAQEQVSSEGYVVHTKPEQIVVVGHPTLHRGVLKLLQDPGIELTVLTKNDQFTDPTGNAKHVASRVRVSGEPSQRWLQICDAASRLAAETVREQLEKSEDFTGLHVAAAIADTLGVGDTLVVGASNPIRDVAFVGLPFDGVSTYSPRGAAGIDGTVAQAVGVALATQAMHPEEIRAPRTVALLGDVTFLHDVGGLLIGPDEPRPENLTIVVANDNGCGIFETLEQGAEEYRDRFERVFGTPHDAQISDICAGYGVEHQEVTSLPELIDALMDSIEEPPAFRVIEARTTRASRRDLHANITKAVKF